MLIEINGSPVNVLHDTLSIDDAIGERSTASFVVKTGTATHFQQGQPVEIYGGISTNQVGTGTASASSSYTGVPASNAFDGSPATVWGNNSAMPSYLQYDFGEIKNIDSYRIYFSATTAGWDLYEYSPNDWQFQGSNDATNWNTLDTRTGQGWSVDGWKEYQIGNSAASYRYYRLYITASKNSVWSSLGELELLAPSLIYAGVIEKPSEKKIPGQDVLLHSIQCKDMHYLADKRVIAKAYETTAAGTIVQDIITLKLAAEGVTAGTIQAGPTINEAVFNYVPVTRALEALAEKAGFIWYIDFDKTLHFKDRATNVAPWTVTGADIKTDVSVEHGNPQYRNYQYIKGGTDITDPQTETFKGDGAQKAFSTSYKVAKVPTIKVNGVSKTVGVRGRGNDTEEWFWAKGENAVSQKESGTPLTLSDTLSVTYQGEFSIIAISKDTDQIINRQSVEMNSGINEVVTDEPETSTREAAFQSAAAKLRKYSIIGRRVKFRTTRTGLEAGQIATINLPAHGLDNAEMLIENVQISDNGGALFYSVTAAEGPEQGSWAKMFESMATRGQAFIIRENVSESEILVTLDSFSESVAWTESGVAQTVYSCPIPSTGLFPAVTRYPC